MFLYFHNTILFSNELFHKIKPKTKESSKFRLFTLQWICFIIKDKSRTVYRVIGSGLLVWMWVFFAWHKISLQILLYALFSKSKPWWLLQQLLCCISVMSGSMSVFGVPSLLYSLIRSSIPSLPSASSTASQAWDEDKLVKTGGWK